VLDLLREGESREVRADLLSYAKYTFELCAVTRLAKANQEEEDFVDVVSGWG
jgi:phenylalanyl-tRNA synthetase beta subunit